MTSEEALFPIVGIGASAGGIQAIEEFFKAVPKDLDIGFVVVTHLSPDHESLLHEIVERCTSMSVFVIEDGMVVRPNCVFVMPANTILTIEDGTLHLRRPNPIRRERNPIDIFFATLAKDRGEFAGGIVLSGGGADGTLGIKAIKQRGGLTIAQTADGTKPMHPDMPRSAIAAGMVDHPVPIHDMPARLLDFHRNANQLRTLRELELDDEQTSAIRKAVYDALRKQTGHDFSGYKTKTFMRRIHRRMQIIRVPSIDAYVRRLHDDHEEVTLLFRDLLINVTNFFRDLDAFEVLQKSIIPRLFEGRSADDTVRVWVPGCATGEEVYSIGMMIREHMDTLKALPRVQIFATDIDDPALVVARTGRYPEVLLDAVSPERRRRFFIEDAAGSYVVAKEVRDLCVFSPHSVIRDPPFSRIDLISCRNLLIYFGSDVQNQVLPIFHYSLRPGGYLFLGTSENIGQFSDLFAPVDKKQRIFQARDHGAARRLPAAMYGPRSTPFVQSHTSSTVSVPLRHIVESRVVDRFAPAHVVINAEGDVVYVSQHTGKYLEVPHGPPSRQLMAMARRGLRLDLRSAFHDVVETRQTVVRNNVVIDDEDDEIQMVKLTLDPLPRDAGEALFLVLFEDAGPVVRPESTFAANYLPADGAVGLLEQELRDTRERLQSMIEEYETALEELKSSNEELVSVNEELQSTNEELEASKEELQSLNEELQTVNMELTNKLDDLDRANGDLRNLFESTQIATVFLDRALVIRSFTPAVSRIFRLIPADRGRPLTDLAIHPAYPALQDHVRQVFETGDPIEHRIAEPTDQTRYLVRLIPYRGTDQRIEGVVVTFVDITTLAKAEEQQDALIAALNHRVKTTLAAAVTITRDTDRQGLSVDAFIEALITRLNAMAETYEPIGRDKWTEAALLALITQTLMPFGSRCTMSGPHVTLAPKAALAMGIAVKELLTNAEKHGALSTQAGGVAVTWSLVNGTRLAFAWTEHGGPAPPGPIKPGFGLRLIEHEIAGLDGTVTIETKSGGLVVTLTFTC